LLGIFNTWNSKTTQIIKISTLQTYFSLKFIKIEA
jgi:hypothetical protein